MELSKKSELFILDSPLAEPNEVWNSHDKYLIERIVTADGTITWYGINTNWKKELGQNWTELATNDNAKPLEKYLPEIIYGEDRIYWKECDTPLYEKMYVEYYRKKSIKELAFRDDKGNLVISQKDYIRIMSQQNTTTKIVYIDTPEAPSVLPTEVGESCSTLQAILDEKKSVLSNIIDKAVEEFRKSQPIDMTMHGVNSDMVHEAFRNACPSIEEETDKETDDVGTDYNAKLPNVGTIKPEKFYLHFLNNFFNKNDIIESNGVKLKVLQTPHKKWYRQLFQFISFGLYEAPIQYKVIQVDLENLPKPSIWQSIKNFFTKNK